MCSNVSPQRSAGGRKRKEEEEGRGRKEEEAIEAREATRGLWERTVLPRGRKPLCQIDGEWLASAAPPARCKRYIQSYLLLSSSGQTRRRRKKKKKKKRRKKRGGGGGGTKETDDFCTCARPLALNGRRETKSYDSPGWTFKSA